MKKRGLHAKRVNLSVSIKYVESNNTMLAFFVFYSVAASTHCSEFIGVEACISEPDCAWCPKLDACESRLARPISCADWCALPVITLEPQPGSGFANQRIALLVLASLAFSAHRPFLLPDIRHRFVVSKDIENDAAGIERFEEI